MSTAVFVGLVVAFLLALVAVMYAFAAHHRALNLERALGRLARRVVLEQHYDDDSLYVDDALRRLMRELGYQIRYTESHYKLERKETP
jgi:hypothetical protein